MNERAQPWHLVLRLRIAGLSNEVLLAMQLMQLSNEVDSMQLHYYRSQCPDQC